MAYRHIIWDWNGTLLDDAWLCVEVLNGLLQRRGRAPISREDYRANFGFPVIRFYDYLGFDTDNDSFAEVSREFIGDYEQRWFAECALHAEAAATLRALTGLGLSHSVLSAAKQEALDAGVVHFGIREHFTGLAGTDNIYAEGKVARGRLWMENLPWDPQEVVLIGDTRHDHEVALAMNADCVLLAHGHHSAERLEATGRPVLHSFTELVAWLQDD